MTTTARSVRWNAIGQLGSQATRLVTTLVLAQLLVSEDFGVMAMVVAVTGTLERFVDLGTGQAIIQRKNLDEGVMSSVFWANLAAGALAAAAVFAGAGALASLFAEPRLEPMVAAAAGSVLVFSAIVVPNSLLQRRMQFGVLATVMLSAALLQAVTAVTLAACGAGLWALIAGYYASAMATAIGCWVGARWRPRLVVRAAHLREVAAFSLHLSAFNLVTHLLGQLDTLIIGRGIDTEALGIYSLAKKIVLQPTVALARAVSNVLFARFSQLQDDDTTLARGFVRALAGTALVVFPAMVGLALLAEPLVQAGLKPAWHSIAPLIQLLAPAAMLATLMFAADAVLRAKGRTDLLLVWGIVRATALAAGMLAGLPWGIGGVAAGMSIAMGLVFLPSITFSTRLIALPVTDTLRVLLPVVFACAAMALVVAALTGFLGWLGLVPAALAGCAVVAGVVSYAAVVLRVRPPGLADLAAVFGSSRAARTEDTT